VAFEGLTQRLQDVFKKLRGKGKISAEDVNLAMREVRLALLEADVNFKVVKDFIGRLQYTKSLLSIRIILGSISRLPIPHYILQKPLLLGGRMNHKKAFCTVSPGSPGYVVQIQISNGSSNNLPPLVIHWIMKQC
jgi:hypothetical protein